MARVHRLEIEIAAPPFWADSACQRKSESQFFRARLVLWNFYDTFVFDNRDFAMNIVGIRLKNEPRKCSGIILEGSLVL